MIIRNLEGTEYMLEAISDTSHELNGNKSLSFIIHPSENNKQFIYDVEKLWELVDADDVVYKIIYLNPKGKGDSLTVQVKAVPKSFDDLNSDRVYERIDQHMTAFECFSRIFDNTDYRFILLDSFPAVQWEGFADGDTRLEMFKNALNRYGAEFELLGNQFRIRHMVGRDTQFMYHYKLNASNISKEEDASNYWTYIKGFGDYGIGSSEEGSNDDDPKLEMDYISPLAEIVGIRHAPPVKDGRITDENTMMARLKEVVDNSVKLNVSTTLHDLRDQGYPLARPQVGDRVYLVDDRITLNTEMRVVSIREIRNIKDELIKVMIDLGTDPMAKRRQSNLNSTADQLRDLLKGRIRLPISAFDETVARISKALLDAETEVTFGPNGIIATDKNDPNKFVIFNSEGIGVSVDGGATFRQAITSEGVNAEQIIGINSEFVRTSWNSDNGSLYVDGDVIHSKNIAGDGLVNEVKLEDGTVVLVSNVTGDTRRVNLDGAGLVFTTDNRVGRIRFNGQNYVFDTNLGMYGNHINNVDWMRLSSSNTHLQSHPTASGGALIDSTRLALGFGNRDDFEDVLVLTSGLVSIYKTLHLRDSEMRGVNRIDLQNTNGVLAHSIADLGGTVLADGTAVSLGIRMGTGLSFSRRIEMTGRIDFYRNLWMNGNTVGGESDIRLKKNIVPTQKDSLSIIEDMFFTDFEWKKDDYPEGTHFGVMAQETHEELVLHYKDEDEDKDVYGIDMHRLSLHNSHAIQQLSKTVNDQRKEIDDLRALVNKLVESKE